MLKKNKLIPNKIINKKKIGFNSDISDWLDKNKFRGILNNMVNDNNGFFNSYLNGKYARELIDLHFQRKKKLDVLVWTMLTLEIWHRVCGEGDKNFFN